MNRPSLRLVSEQPDKHPHGCDCADCAWSAPSVPERLSANDIGLLAIAGAAVGSVIAFVIDPAGAAHALAAIVGLS